VCANCGHDIEINKSLAMETALSIQGDEAPCSAKNMTFAQTAVYIRTLELQWMRDQRRIRELEQQLTLQSDGLLQREPVWPGGHWAKTKAPDLAIEGFRTSGD
jgi:hypothetical protein